MAKLALKARKEVKAHEAARDKHLKRIGAALGVGDDVGCQAALVELVAAAKQCGYADRAGEICYEAWLDALASRLEADCKDEMVRAEYAARFGARVVVLRVNDGVQSYHARTYFSVDGALVCEARPDSLWSNVTSIGGELLESCGQEPPSADAAAC